MPRKKITYKKWIRHNVILSITLLSTSTLFWLSQADTYKSAFILSITNLLALLLIFLTGQLWFYSYKKANNHSFILRYINNNFSEFNIEKEFASLGRNKLFLLHNNNQRYILKIIRKSIRHAKTEVAIMNNLGSCVRMPKLISYNIKLSPRYILMTYCGSKLSTINEESYYYSLGKLIAQISDIPLTDSLLNTFNKKATTKIQSFIENTDSQHPYMAYLGLCSTFPANYFAHGNLSLRQSMLKEDCITIIDWESACLNYRLADLAKALSYTLNIKCATHHAQAIFAGHTAKKNYQIIMKLNFYLVLFGQIYTN